MDFSEINPFLRFAQLQPTIIEGNRYKAAYDYRIFYILSGTAAFLIEEQQIILHPGTILFFRPGIFYRFIGNIKVIVLNFDLTRNQSNLTEAKAPSEATAFRADDIFENDPPDEFRQPIVIAHAPETEYIFRKCVSDFLCPTPYSDALNSALVKEILCFIAQAHQNGSRDLPEVVRQVVLYIRENFDSELNNTSIASVFGYHPFYLNRLFKKHIGKTIHQALLEVRIQSAKQLLTDTTLTVEEIVRESGFSDRTQFGIAFRKATGVSPSQYRKAAGPAIIHNDSTV